MALKPQDLLNGQTPHSAEVVENMKVLLKRVNVLLSIYGKTPGVTSGYRTPAKHIQIYQQIAKKQGKIFDISKVPFGSKHLTGQAVDLYDPKQQFQLFLTEHTKYLEDIGLWCEDFTATKDWVHLQCVPPKSGARFFKP